MTKKFNIEYMQKLANEKGGKCLSKEYINADTPLEWECEKGHKWKTKPSNIVGRYNKKGAWCHYCSGFKGLSSSAYEFAKKNNGNIISKKYKNSKSIIKWQCSKGHTWKSSLTSMKQRKNFCLTCAGIKTKPNNYQFSINHLKQVAKKNKGLLLTKKYYGVTANYKWQCSKGHKFFARADSIKRGQWCRKCAEDSKRSSIEKMNQMAKKRGGKCLSKRYVSAHKPLKWECKNGHQWYAAAANIRGNSTLRPEWCPYCSNTFLSEEICRTIFEQIFDNKFLKKRPTWLVNSDGNRMELDGYCENLKLAFEYQGKQHFNLSSFITSQKDLDKRQKDDRRKKYLCKKNKVQLIVINYRDNLDNLPNIIKERLNKNSKIYKKANFNKKIKLVKSWHIKDRIDEMHKIAQSRGGKCLSESYINNSTKLKWQCSKGHVWFAVPFSIKNNGTWCKICSYKNINPERYNLSRAKGLEILKKIAKKNNAKILTKTYKNRQQLIKWECVNGHKFSEKSSLLKNRKIFCKECGK